MGYTTYHLPVNLRGALFLGLSDTGYVLRPTVVDDLGGGGTSTFGTAGTYPCRVDPAGGGESSLADRISERTTHRISLPPMTDVRSSDRFKVSGVTFEITAVRTRTEEDLRVLEVTKA